MNIGRPCSRVNAAVATLLMVSVAVKLTVNWAATHERSKEFFLLLEHRCLEIITQYLYIYETWTIQSTSTKRGRYNLHLKKDSYVNNGMKIRRLEKAF